MREFLQETEGFILVNARKETSGDVDIYQNEWKQEDNDPERCKERTT